MQEVELVLNAGEAAAIHGGGLRELVGRKIGAADLDHLALLLKVAERAERIHDRRARVWAMQLKQVDAVRAQPCKACLDGRVHRLGRRSSRLLDAVLQARAELRRDDDFVALALQRKAEIGLA